ERGRVWSGGHIYFGELGVGIPDGFGMGSDRDKSRLELVSEQRFVALAVGRQFSLAIARDGALWGWGHNDEHELGLGDDRSRHAPELIDAKHAYAAIGAGHGFAVALASTGQAFAWGGGTLGALGDGG